MRLDRVNEVVKKFSEINHLAPFFEATSRNNSFKNKDLRESLKVNTEVAAQIGCQLDGV
jgi:hypothetical protein